MDDNPPVPELEFEERTEDLLCLSTKGQAALANAGIQQADNLYAMPRGTLVTHIAALPDA